MAESTVVTAAGVYVEVEPDNRVLVSSAGVYVEIEPDEAQSRVHGPAVQMI